MAEGENKAIFRHFYEDAWTTGDLAIVDELLAADFVNHELADTSVPHRELYKQAIVETRSAFPDWTVIIDDLIAEGERVAARWRSYGTHTRAFLELPPTGKRIEIRGITIVRVVDGKITDFWKRDDSHTVSEQLGVAQS